MDAEQATRRFQLRIALLAAGLTFFGAIVGNLQVRADDDGAIAAREAERTSLLSVNADLAHSADYWHQYGVRTLGKSYDRRAAVARGRARLARGDEARASALRDEAGHWERVREVVGSLTPLLGEARYAGDEGLVRYSADRYTETDRIRLTSEAFTETANAWDEKSSAYVAIVTVLAVSLFLQGLSLTVAADLRRWLAIPAVLLFGVCIGWTVLTAVRAVPDTPRRAIEHVVEGNRLVGVDEPGKAVDEYTEALRLRSDYAEAFARRADAHFELATEETGAVVESAVITDGDELDAAIRDGERAVANGTDDPRVLGNLGDQYFYAGRYEDAERATSDAVGMNPDEAFLWLNLAYMRAALGDEAGADEALDRGLELATAEQNESLTGELIAGTRTGLERVRRDEEQREALVQRLLGDLSVASLEYLSSEPVARVDPDDAAIDGETAFTVEGGAVVAEHGALAPDGTPIEYVWYHRSDPGGYWVQDASLVHWAVAAPLDDDSGETGYVGVERADPGGCVGSRQYRLDVYAANVLVSSEVAAGDDGEPIEVESLLGDTETFADEDLGLQACRPEGWTVETEDDFVTIEHPDDPVFLQLGSQPVGAVDDAAALERESIDAIAAALGSAGTVTPLDDAPRPVTFGDAEGLLADYRIEAGGGTIYAGIGASMAEDGILRTMFIMGFDDPDLVAALRDTVRFRPGPAIGEPVTDD